MEMIPMDRCAMAYQYRKEGYNCAQAVAASFADLTGLTPETMMAAAKGFGGGVGGSFQELCGAVSGAVLVLGMLDPDVTETDRAGRKRVYPKAKALRDRFEVTFGHIHCGDLRAARPGATDKTPAAVRLGVTAHCDIMVVTAVELLEALLNEEAD